MGQSCRRRSLTTWWLDGEKPNDIPDSCSLALPTVFTSRSALWLSSHFLLSDSSFQRILRRIYYWLSLISCECWVNWNKKGINFLCRNRKSDIFFSISDQIVTVVDHWVSPNTRLLGSHKSGTAQSYQWQLTSNEFYTPTLQPGQSWGWVSGLALL